MPSYDLSYTDPNSVSEFPDFWLPTSQPWVGIS